MFTLVTCAMLIWDYRTIDSSALFMMTSSMYSIHYYYTNYVYYHYNYRLILIAEKEKVYKEFPTPLINRLEKHFVVTSTILTDEQLKLEKELKTWVNNFTPTGKR